MTMQRLGSARVLGPGSARSPGQQVLPTMDRHPMFRVDVSAKDTAFPRTWNAS